MRWLFWGSVILLAYTYVGYAAWLWLCSRWRKRPVRTGSITPRISVVLVVRNEAATLRDKLRNLVAMDYPPDFLEVVVVSDGSTDATPQILAEYAAAEDRLRVVLNPQPRGKAAGLNEALQMARGEIVVFTDARQILEPDAVRLLAGNFADLSVGCASGELMLGNPESGETSSGLGLYWRIEKKVREWESASGSVVGATGALYAVRRELIPEVPEGTILDDVYIPMQVVRRNARVIFDPRARAWDAPDLGSGREFARKVRTLGGNYQLLQLAPWLLGRENPIRFEFVSHKLLRLVAPFALVAALVAAAFLRGPLYGTALVLQLAFYGLSLLALARLARGPVARFADASCTFVVLNSAALVAFANFVRGRKAAWGR
jgi:poly-beta-1,6-N-acetyl-D-glucosamine synthase